MSVLSSEKINEIRNSVNIVDIISKYVSLEPKGKNYFGICPFHDDNHPSMSVSKEKQIYTCFSCGATGNVYKFLMDYENISFKEAVQKIADMSGIKVDITHTSKATPKNNNLYDIYNLSLKLYMNNINTAKGKEAKTYLHNRGITDDIIKEFQIGLSLDSSTLSKILEKKFNEKDILNSGLSKKTTYGYMDLFYDRIMFPLYDLNGNVVAYSGRIYNKQDDSKYFNTRETEIFKKGELLYNYHRAKDSARAKDQIIIMEGFMDVIRAHTIGITNVIATMGTAVTKNQALLIKRMAKEVILCFDGDEAGAKATFSCADILLELGVTAKVIRLENNMDPDEYIQKHGKEAFELKLNNPISIMDFKLNYLKQNKNLDSAVEEANYINGAINELNKIDDEILKEVTIKKIVRETNIDEELIRSKLTGTTPKIEPKKEVPQKTSKYEVAQLHLVGYMLKSADAIETFNDNTVFIPGKEYRLLAREICLFYKENNFISEADLFDYIEYDEELMATISKIEKEKLKESVTTSEINDYINVIMDYNIKTEIKRLKEQMKEEQDPLKKAAIAQKIIDLKKGV